MAKTDVFRITDTLTFLQNTAIVGWPERAAAYLLAQDYVNAVFPNPATPAYQQFSESLSLGYHVREDPDNRRKMARALFVLWNAMRHFDIAFTLPVPNIKQINQGTVERVLTNYIRKARCMYDRLHGGAAGANYVLTVFQANPSLFLSDNKVFVSGSGFLDAPQAPQNVLASKFEYNPYADRYEFGVRQPVGAGAANIQVESVTAFHWTDQRYVPRPAGAPPLVIGATNFTNMTGIELSGGHAVVTTQFTGCAFCMAEHGGHMYCAHVSPAGVPNMAPNTDGNTLAARVIATHGAFVNAGGAVVRVFGRNVGSPPTPTGYDIGLGGGAQTYMTIVGFPGGGSYHMYAQTTRDYMIREVKQIF